MSPVSKSEFEKAIKSKKLVLVDFFATWCGPCQMMAPAMKNIEEKYEKDENAEVLTINIDENPEIPAKYSIMSVPSFLYIKNDKVLETIIGATTEDNLIEKIEKYKKG